MPLVDMPLEELKRYQGRNPRPADHDAYWARALAEMSAVDPKVELVPHAFNAPYAECFDLYFTGVRGARIHAKYVRPARMAGKHPAVLLFHGYSGSSGEWSDKLNWAAHGFSVAALDCRGQGGKSEDVGGVKGNTLRGHIIRGLDDAPDNLLFRHIFLDTAQLAGIVMGMPEVDPDRVGARAARRAAGSPSPARRSSRGCAAPSRSTRSSATTSACGRWTLPGAPTRSSPSTSVPSTPSTSGKPRSLRASATSTTSTWRRASRARCGWPRG